MPRKYRAAEEDFLFVSGAESIFGMLRPIEEKLRAGGYKGLLLADYYNEIYKELGVIDEEATRKKQEEMDKKQGGKAEKVGPVYKKTPTTYIEMQNAAEMEDQGNMYIENQIAQHQTLTRDAEKIFRNYIKGYENYLDLLIKNTPEKEYPQELSELRYHKAYIRMLKVFGSRELLEDQLAFAINGRAYDGDTPSIKEVGNNLKNGVSRELWRSVHKYYPYSEHGGAITALINTACDYEENKQKDTYIEQIKARDQYKKALQDYLASCKALEVKPGEKEITAKRKITEDTIKKLKREDGPEKDIDYEAIMKRVEEQEKNGLVPDPEEKKIVDDIHKAVDEYYIKNEKGDEIDAYNSLYYRELDAMGYCTNEKDFTGARGNGSFFHEVEAQINAIDMGWPMDELIHIERLHRAMRTSFKRKTGKFTPEEMEFKNSIKTFYDEKIKDKPYPATEEERQALYRELYELSNGIAELSKQTLASLNNDEEEVEVVWNEIRDDIKKTMDKPLTFAQKLVLDHVQKDPEPEVTAEEIGAIKNSIGKDRFGHSNSAEYKALKKAMEQFEAAFKADENGFTEVPGKEMSPEKLKLLEELREKADAYLMDKDKEKKLPAERSAMGKERYEGAVKAYHLADKLLKAHEARLEQAAKEKKEAECRRGRKEAREAFFDPDSPKGKKAIETEILRAGSKEAYLRKKEEEVARDREEAGKEPVTDAEKYERFINDCRVKKEEPAVYEDEVYNKEMQQMRLDNLGNMLAALEFREAGKEFDKAAIVERGAQLKTLYSLDSLKLVTKGMNGPEKLKDALTFTFRADDLRTQMEESLYDVGKVKYKNIGESQRKYQKDIGELLSAKKPEHVSENTRKIIDALTDIKNIDLQDKTLVGIHSYELRKANAKLMEAVTETFKQPNAIQKDAYGSKLALDSLAVLGSYTGCQAVTNRLLQKLNTRVKDQDGNRMNINIEDFHMNYGVKHSRDLARRMQEKKVQAGKKAEANRHTKAGTEKKTVMHN